MLCLFLVMVMAGRGVWLGASKIGQAGEIAAMLSAALLMPDGSAPLLQERFRAEIYNPEGDHATGEKEQGIPLEPDGSDAAPQQQEEPGDLSPTQPGPRIAPEYAAPIISENFQSKAGGAILQYGAGLIRNETTHSLEEITEILQTPWPVAFAHNGEPEVLIVHTHATEAFEQYDSDYYDIRNTWRSTDNRNNMVAVGDAMAQILEENGIAVLHDTTQHDYPSYNGSYERSAETIQGYLEDYPSIRVVLDLHRDAMQREDAIVKPVAVIDGKKAAQIMIISTCEDGSIGVPEWRQNLRFAALLQNKIEEYAPGLTRPVYFCYRKYNMDLTTGSLLLEFGSNANTLDEAVYAAQFAGQALADLIHNQTDSALSEDEVEDEV